MMRRIPITALASFIALSSVVPIAAQTPYGYINGSFHNNKPTGDFGDRVGNAIGGWGGELSVGLTSDNGSTYLGHRWSDFDKDNARGPEWRAMDRWIAGFRWNLIGNLMSPLTPVLGAGATMGDSEMKRRIDSDDPESEVTVKSRNDFGWFAEAGAELRLPSRLSVTGTAQYHRFDADFESAVFDNPKYKIEYLTFLIGLNIRLAGPSR